MPTAYGRFVVQAHTIDGLEHAVIRTTMLENGALIRVHSECLTGDIFGSCRCDCGDQLHTALRMIEADGNGAVIYLRGHEGRAIGLANKINAYALQDQGLDTVEANHQLGFPTDARDYHAAINICNSLGLSHFRLLTNNPDKRTALNDGGLTISEIVPLVVGENPHNAGYIDTKRRKLGHRL